MTDAPSIVPSAPDDEPPGPGAVRFLISCDESGTGGARYYGFGSLWMSWQRRGDFARGIAEIRERTRYSHEFKWNNLTHQVLAAYVELIDYFFQQRWLSFHCIVVEKATVKRELHGGDYDLARRKHFSMLLTNKMRRCMRNYPGREITFRIWVDPIASRYKKADEAVHQITNNVLAEAFAGGHRPVDTVLTHNSRSTPSIQLCDVLLGAVMETYQCRSTSPAKASLRAAIADRLGWPDLDADTHPAERKFNVWYFYDKTLGPRAVDTRTVSLLHPHPPIPRRTIR